MLRKRKKDNEESTPYTYRETLGILERYCAYQDRCRQDISKKFNDLDLPEEFIERALQELEEEGFINEQRYASMFVRGHFRQNKWGRLKIRQTLHQKQIPSKIIETALKEIEGQYDNTIFLLMQKKAASIKEGTNKMVIMNKLQQFGLQKGYESSVVYECIKRIMSNK